MDSELPEYRGVLIPVSWSQIKLTPAVKLALSRAALPGCPSCNGVGYLTSKDTTVHPCHCTRRSLGSLASGT